MTLKYKYDSAFHPGTLKPYCLVQHFNLTPGPLTHCIRKLCFCTIIEKKFAHLLVMFRHKEGGRITLII